MSPIAQLPDDVLCSVFKHVPSFLDKFALASVSQKFRRCMLMELRAPQALCMDFNDKLLNGVEVHIDNWPTVVRLLAEKTQFSEIRLLVFWERLFSIPVAISALESITETDCLQKLTKLEHDYLTPEQFRIVRKIIEGSPKLSVLKCYLPEDLDLMKVAEALANICLVDMEVTFRECSQQDIMRIIESVKLHNLKRMIIEIDEISLLSALGGTTYESFAVTPDLLRTIARLPVLRQCILSRVDYPYKALRLAECVVEYLSNCPTNPPYERIVKCINDDRSYRGCELVNAILQVQAQMPDSRFKIHVMPHGHFDLEFYLKTDTKDASIILNINCIDCGDAVCGTLHPVALFRLREYAAEVLIMNEFTADHYYMKGLSLDRCRIGQLVQDLNVADHYHKFPKAIEIANINRDHVTVTFERSNGSDLFITVNVDHCFDPVCLACSID